jgi:hypothetical protein
VQAQKIEQLQRLLLEAAEDLEEEGVSKEWTKPYRDAAQQKSDLIKRLRGTTFLQVSHPHFAPMAEAAHEAADEIESLLELLKEWHDKDWKKTASELFPKDHLVLRTRAKLYANFPPRG